MHVYYYFYFCLLKVLLKLDSERSDECKAVFEGGWGIQPPEIFLS